MIKNSYRNKIILSCILTMSVIIIGCMSYSVYWFYQKYSRQIEKDYSYAVDSSAIRFQYIQDDIKMFSKTVAADRELQETLASDTENSTLRQMVADREIYEILRYYGNMKNYIQRVDLWMNGELYSSLKTEKEQTKYDDVKSILDELTESGGTDRFFGAHRIHGGVAAQKENVLTYSIRVRSYRDSSMEGYLLVHFQTELLHDALNNVDIGDIFLLSDTGEVLAAHGKSGETQEPEIADFKKDGQWNEKDYLFIQNDRMMNGWEILCFISKSEVKKQLSSIILFYVFMGVLIVILPGFFVTLVLIHFSKPVEQLMDTANEVSQGNLLVRARINTGDELQKLGEVFNNMLLSLQEQMKREREDEKVKSKLKTDLLMAQINPHFIYNTLNSVIYLCKLKRQEEAAELCRVFIVILQSNLKSGIDGFLSSVEEETDNLEKYLEIQKFMYPGRFRLELEVPEELKEKTILRMIMQPIVENALFHGILPTNRPGIISVRVWQDLDNLYLQIRDNGIGMGEAKVNELLNGDTPVKLSSQMHSIGFYNIRERIRIFYGGTAVMKIKSKPGEGTCVLIAFPLRFEAMEGD